MIPQCGFPGTREQDIAKLDPDIAASSTAHDVEE
jgi:hypothetical protein